MQGWYTVAGMVYARLQEDFMATRRIDRTFVDWNEQDRQLSWHLQEFVEVYKATGTALEKKSHRVGSQAK